MEKYISPIIFFHIYIYIKIKINIIFLFSYKYNIKNETLNILIPSFCGLTS